MTDIVHYICILGLLILNSCGQKEPEKKPGDDDLTGKEIPAATVGEPLPAWSDGCLDIHFISTNRGECAFYILPDGTTMVVDAGDIHSSNDENPQRPDSQTRAYETYSKYIKHFLPASSGGKLDYAFLTHFHIDHMGEINGSNAVHPEGGYQLCGLSGLFETVPFRTIVDRGFPTYSDDPSIFSPTQESQSTGNYIKFVNYVVGNKGVNAQRFIVGTERQFVLTGENRAKYKHFRIFNHVGNGMCYRKDDVGNEYISTSTPASENATSCGIHIKYGKFDFITAGDLVSAPQNQQAFYNSECVGHLEAFKSNHHLNSNSWGSKMKELNFSPRVVIVPSFSTKHADPDIMTYLLEQSWQKDIYLTKNWDSNMEAHKDMYSKCAGYDGHVVIRVAPGGSTFQVYMLDNTGEQYTVKSVSETYASK